MEQERRRRNQEVVIPESVSVSTQAEKGRASKEVQPVTDPRVIDVGDLVQMPDRVFENWHELLPAARALMSHKLQGGMTREEFANGAVFMEFVHELTRGNHVLAVPDHLHRALGSYLYNDLLGLGTVGLFLQIPDVEDIFLDRWDTLDVVKSGVKYRVSETGFVSDEDVKNWLDSRVFAPINAKFNRSNPSENAILSDGSRLIAFQDPISPYTSFAIRKHKHEIFRTVADYYSTRVAPEGFFQDLNVWVKTGRNLVLSGATGSGKTTAINVAIGLIPDYERILTLEDTPELQSGHFRVKQLYTYEEGARAGSSDDEKSIPMSDLLRYALRAKPDRIVIGEVRGREALDMLDALNTGHAGSMTSLHANSPIDAITRLLMMCSRHPARANISDNVLISLIASVVDVVVQMKQVPGVGRRVTAAYQVLYEQHYFHRPEVLKEEGVLESQPGLFLRPLWVWQDGGLQRVNDFIHPDHDIAATPKTPRLKTFEGLKREENGQAGTAEGHTD